MPIVNIKVVDLGGDPVKNALVAASLRRIDPSRTIPQGIRVPSSDVGPDQWMANIVAGVITDAQGEAVLNLQPNENYDVDSFYEFLALDRFPVFATDRPKQLWAVWGMVPTHESNLRFITTKPGEDPTIEEIRNAGFVITTPDFENVTGLDQSVAGELTKTAVTGVYDAGADTTKSILKGSFGYFEAVADGASTRAFGLSPSAGDNDITGIKYGVEMLAGGNAQPVFDGALVGSAAAYADGDTFRVEIDLNGNVQLYQNGTSIHTFATVSTEDALRGVSSFATSGAKLTSIKLAADELRLNS